MSERASAAWMKIMGGTIVLLIGALVGTFAAGKAYGGDGERLDRVEATVRDHAAAIEENRDLGRWLRTALRTGRDPDTGVPFPWAK